MAAEKSRQKIIALCWRKISSIISYYFQIEKSDVRSMYLHVKNNTRSIIDTLHTLQFRHFSIYHHFSQKILEISYFLLDKLRNMIYKVDNFVQKNHTPHFIYLSKSSTSVFGIPSVRNQSK